MLILMPVSYHAALYYMSSIVIQYFHPELYNQCVLFKLPGLWYWVVVP